MLDLSDLRLEQLDLVLKVLYVYPLLRATVLLLEKLDIVAVQLDLSLLQLLLILDLVAYSLLGLRGLPLELLLPPSELLHLLDGHHQLLLFLRDSFDGLLASNIRGLRGFPVELQLPKDPGGGAPLIVALEGAQHLGETQLKLQAD